MPFFKPEYIIVGYDHHFGNNREGSPEFLGKFCSERNIGLEVVQPVSDDGHHISSTRIRELIKDGFVRRANFELGAVFGFEAIVVKGAGRGKELTFPTANVILNWEASPAALVVSTGTYNVVSAVILDISNDDILLLEHDKVVSAVLFATSNDVKLLL